MDDQLTAKIAAVARIIGKARSLLFVTGAGISADSGVPTYRGIGGLYDVQQTEEGYPIEEVLSGEMFEKNPTLTWKYLLQIGRAAEGASPNRAHEFIAWLEKSLPRVWTLTQNVDGFHRLAGSQNVVEIHGNMHSLYCTSCSSETRVNDYKCLDSIPNCGSCRSIMRPNVVLFGEALPQKAIAEIFAQIELGFDAVLSVGTSSLFPYIRMPITEARRQGVPTIEINPSETVISRDVDYHLPLGASDALGQIWSIVSANSTRSTI